MNLTPLEIAQLAEAIADHLTSKLGSPSGDQVGDVNDAARWLKCSVPSVERAVRDGQIPSFKVGRLRRFRRADLLAMSSATQGDLK